MLKIRLFGIFALEWAGRPFALVAPPRAVSLLAWLLLHPSTQTREQLAAQLWPELSDDAARANLRRHLNQLTHALPPAPSDQPWLIITRNSVQWNPAADYWLDVSAFERACADDDARITELYRGDLLTDVFDDWLLYQRERLRNLYLAALERLARQALVQHQYAAAASYARRMLDADPLHEDYIRLLISIRYAAGDRAGAIADYERFRRELQSELNTEPMPETLALYEAVVHNTSLPQLATDSRSSAASVTSQQRKPFILPFAGREPAMAQLTSAWQQAQQGRGGLTLISGEAGIGKTRLTAEVSAMALAQGGRAIRGEAAGDSFPYQTIVTALRSALPLLAAIDTDPTDLSALLPLLPELRQRRPDLAPLPRLEPQQERDRLYFALTTCIAAISKPRPLLLILEDLHWANAASLDFLRFFAARIADQRLLVVATYREGEVGRNHPLHDLRRSLEPFPNVQHLALNRLDEAAVGEIVNQVHGLQGDEVAAQLYAEGEGNPLFLSELVNNRLERGATPMHAGIHALINERVGRLQPNTRLLAEVAAVAGAEFDTEVVREVAGWNVGQALTALDELLDHNLVRDEGRRSGYDYAFSHHLIQEAIYSAIDEGVRTRRHRRTARVLEELYAAAGDELAISLARHFDLGADPDAALPYYLKAARHALTVYADEEALAAASRVLELGGDLHLRFDALALRESIYQRQGHRDAQRADLSLMAEIAEELSDDDLICEVLRRQIDLQDLVGDLESQARFIDELTGRTAAGKLHWQAVALQAQALYQFRRSNYLAIRPPLEQAISIYQHLGDLAAQVECYCLIVDYLTERDEFSDMNALLAQASALLTDIDSPALQARVLTATAKVARWQANYAKELQLATQLLTLYQHIHDRKGEADTHLMIVMANYSLSDYAPALEHYFAAKRLYAQLGNLEGEARVTGNLGAVFNRFGRYRDSIKAFQQAQALYQKLENKRGLLIAAMNIAITAVQLNDYILAKASAKQGLALLDYVQHTQFEAVLLSTIGAAELWQGQLKEAIEHLTAALSLRANSAASDFDEYLEHDLLALAYLHLGDLASARQQNDAALALTIYSNDPSKVFNPVYVHWVNACVERAAGRIEVARDYMLQAYAALEEKMAAAQRELDVLPGDEWRTTFLNAPYHRDVLAAYERDEWPAYTSPPSSVS